MKTTMKVQVAVCLLSGLLLGLAATGRVVAATDSPPDVCYDILDCYVWGRNCPECSNPQGSCGQYRVYYAYQSFLIEVDPIQGGYENYGSSGSDYCYAWRMCEVTQYKCLEDDRLYQCGGPTGEWQYWSSPDWWILTDPC
jgi:hypothetical protein